MMKRKVAGLLACLPLLAAGPLAAQEFAFPTRVDLPVGEAPIGIVVADFNGDPYPDLATANTGTATVSVLLGTADGTFDFAPPVPDTLTPFAIASADVDGDRDADLLIANDVANVVTVHLGNGNGTFGGEFSQVSVGFEPSGLALGDFDGNGVIDLATANAGDDTVSVAHGIGGGRFELVQVLATGTLPCGLATGDLNGDGLLDLVVSAQDDDLVHVLVGNLDGTFGSGCSGDCNADGDVTVDELVLGVQQALGLELGGSCRTFDSNANGLVTVNELVSAVRHAVDGCNPTLFDVGSFPGGVAIADLDGDTNQDVTVANLGGDAVTVLLGLGGAVFDFPLEFDAGLGPTGVAVADFDRNGTLDLASADSLGDTVSVLSGGGDGSFGTPQAFAVGQSPGGFGCGGIVAADFDGDGARDIATANQESNDVSVLINSGGSRGADGGEK
jgi:hypothetical protein